MQITTEAKAGMTLADAMEILVKIIERDFPRNTGFRVGVDGNDNIVLASGGDVRLVDMGFTLSQVCPVA